MSGLLFRKLYPELISYANFKICDLSNMNMKKLYRLTKVLTIKLKFYVRNKYIFLFNFKFENVNKRFHHIETKMFLFNKI